jgi:CRP/FNR family transcriptional regulator
MTGTMTPAGSSSTQPTVASKLWYLKRFPLFEGFTAQEMGEVERLTQMRNYGKGEVLYLPGEPGNQLYMVKSGVVKISRLLGDGRELTLALLKMGDVFGELEVIGDQRRETQAVAYGDVLLCVIQKRDLLVWMQRKPDLALRITKIIGFRRQVIENKIERLLFRSAPVKLAGLLLDLAEQFGKTGDHDVQLEIPLTHQELANLTGCVRETISELITDFRQRGWIAIDRRRIRLLDLPALQQAANTHP